MTLIERNPAIHLLDGLVKCRNCGTQMETAGESFNEAPRYVCVTRNEGCDTQDTLAEPFNRLMVARTINAILDDRNTQTVLGNVRGEAIERDTEDVKAILDLQDRKPAFAASLERIRRFLAKTRNRRAKQPDTGDGSRLSTWKDGSGQDPIGT